MTFNLRKEGCRRFVPSRGQERLCSSFVVLHNLPCKLPRYLILILLVRDIQLFLLQSTSRACHLRALLSVHRLLQKVVGCFNALVCTSAVLEMQFSYVHYLPLMRMRFEFRRIQSQASREIGIQSQMISSVEISCLYQKLVQRIWPSNLQVALTQATSYK